MARLTFFCFCRPTLYGWCCAAELCTHLFLVDLFRIKSRPWVSSKYVYYNCDACMWSKKEITSVALGLHDLRVKCAAFLFKKIFFNMWGNHKGSHCCSRSNFSGRGYCCDLTHYIYIYNILFHTVCLSVSPAITLGFYVKSKGFLCPAVITAGART